MSHTIVQHVLKQYAFIELIAIMDYISQVVPNLVECLVQRWGGDDSSQRANVFLLPVSPGSCSTKFVVFSQRHKSLIERNCTQREGIGHLRADDVTRTALSRVPVSESTGGETQYSRDTALAFRLASQLSDGRFSRMQHRECLRAPEVAG